MTADPATLQLVGRAMMAACGLLHAAERDANVVLLVELQDQGLTVAVSDGLSLERLAAILAEAGDRRHAPDVTGIS